MLRCREAITINCNWHRAMAVRFGDLLGSSTKLPSKERKKSKVLPTSPRVAPVNRNLYLKHVDAMRASLPGARRETLSPAQPAHKRRKRPRRRDLSWATTAPDPAERTQRLHTATAAVEACCVPHLAPKKHEAAVD